MRRYLDLILNPLKSACLAVWSDKQTVKIVLFLSVVQALGALAGFLFFPHGQSYISADSFDKLLAWDSRFYLSIGQGGYIWNQAYCRVHFCALAFFPLQGIVDGFFLFVFGLSAAKVAILITSWVLGLVSIFCFSRLARTVMKQGAGSAIFLYALYPGSIFFLMGYPTGIMLIAVILALHSALEERWWRSACWIGFGGAAGSSVIFAGFALGIYYLFDQFRRHSILRAGFSAIGWASLALSGLLLFMVYQYISFADATAFVAAQTPWTGSASFGMKVLRLRTFYWYVAYFLETLGWYKTAFHSLLFQHGSDVIMLQNIKMHICDFIEMVEQSVLNLIFFVLALVGIVLCCFFAVGQKSKILLCASSACVFLGYEWFVLATEWGMESTIRLLFPAVAMFVGLGGICHKFKRLEYALFPLFTVVTFLQMAFFISGFDVT